MNGYFLCYKTHFSQTFRIFATQKLRKECNLLEMSVG